MKKTQFLDSVRNIRKRIVSYLSICLVIMLGVGAFLTTRYMEAGIIDEAAGYYQDRGFKDFELISSLGVSEKNIESIKAVPGVTDAEGVMQFDGSLSKGDVKSSVTVLSRTERVSAPLLDDGRMPASKDECAVGEDFAETSGIVIGDKVIIYLSGASDGDPLKGHEYTVTGLIKHPDYVHRKLTNTVVLPLSAFDMSVTSDAYTRVFVKAKDVAFDEVFTSAYFDQTAETKKGLEGIKDSLATDRANEVKTKAYEEIDKEWEEALAELESAEQEIDANESKLDTELANGRQELKDAEDTLASMVEKNSKELEKGEKSIKQGEADLKKARKDLKKAKAAYKTAREMYSSDTEWVDEALDDVDKLLAHLDGTAPMSDEERRETELDLAEHMISHKDELKVVVDLSSSDDSDDMLAVIKKATGQDLSKYVKLIKDLGMDTDEILAPAYRIKDDENAHFNEKELKAIKQILESIKEAESKLDDAKAQIDAAEKTIAEKEALLKSKKAELRSGKKKLANEKAKAEEKIKKGWADYYSNRDKYRSKIAEARALLLENREDAETKLAEAKADVEDISCEYIVLDRNANAGYVDVKVQLDSLRSTGMVFGILFILITAIVCFSTLTIIIDEQKKLLGTVKAFGFHKGEVLSKYLMFGLSAGLVGDILAVLTGLGLSEIVQTVYSASNLYQYGRAATIMTPAPTILISLVMLLVCATASILSSLAILRSPASILMKGETLKKGRKPKRKTSSARRGGSLYSRLIMRNISDDKARVIVSTAIVAFCCMLIGTGLSFKLATTGMLAKQQDEVNLYDLRMDAGDSVTDKELAAMEKIISENASDHTPALYESHLFSTGDTITGMQILAGDPDKLGDYFGIKKEGASVNVTSDGLLIPQRMSENYGFEKGNTFPVFDSSMQLHDATVTGTYTCYFQRVAVTTPEGYSRIFGSDYKPKSFFMHLDGNTNSQEIMNKLLAVNEDISFESPSDFRESFESVGMLYNIIVFVTTGVAIFMSFMILTNLASIFVNRKKNELIVMRINGFSVKQAKGYLAKEALLTTVVGLAIGVIVGSLLSPFAVRILEPADLQFDRSYHAVAWIAAVGLEGLFALVIYSGIFRRIKHFDLRDIA